MTDRPKGEMTFLEHLEELRWHIIRSLIVIIITATLAFFNKKIIFDTILFAPKKKEFFTYRFLCKLSNEFSLGNNLCIDPPQLKIVNLTMSGQFVNHIVISIIAGLIISTPYILWELWRFIKPALYEKEQKASKGIIISSSFLFITGVLFGYFVIVPMSVQFLANYHISNMVQNVINMNSYFTTITSIVLASGIVFELPIIVFFLSKLGLITPKIMKKYRKHMIIISLFISAIITPPDISSQILVAIPLLLLYEFSIFISSTVIKRENL